MKQLTSSEWLAQFLATDPPRSKSLVMTIFGDAIAPHGGAIWLGSLIDLLAPFGVNHRLLRTSVFRLTQEGWLVANRDGRRSSYEILARAQSRLARANRRIYTPLATHWDGSWTMLLGAAAMLEAPTRAGLRKELAWAGFATIAPGIYGHPVASADVIDDILMRLGAQGKMLVCRVTELAGVTSRPLRELAAEGWDLSGVVQGYRGFIEQFRPLLAALEHGEALEPEQAFVIRTLLIHAYRRMQLHDPMLPVELLPDPWPGSEAYALARAVYRLTQAQAELHITAVMRREELEAPEADAAFYERFGGLT